MEKREQSIWKTDGSCLGISETFSRRRLDFGRSVKSAETSLEASPIDLRRSSAERKAEGGRSTLIVSDEVRDGWGPPLD